MSKPNCCLMWSVYGSEQYLPMLDMSIQSSALFAPDIKKILLKDKQIQYSNSLCEIVEAEFVGGASSKMSLRYDFAANLLDEYDYVLHLDNDVLIIKNIHPIFDHMPDRKGLSFASEYTSDQSHFFSNKNNTPSSCDGIYWAGPLLKSSAEIAEFSKVPSICMGVWLAGRDEKSVLRQIRKNVCDAELKGFYGPCYDQHAAVHTIVNMKSWNFSLQDHVTHSAGHILGESDILELEKSTHCIAHFAGGASPHAKKFQAMQNVFAFLTKSKKS